MWNYYSDEPSDPLSSNSESFKYKTSITGNNCNVGAGEAGYDANKVGKNETEIFIPLKHLSNFLKSLNIPLINCEVELILTWPKNCVLADMTVRDAQDDNPAIVAPLGLEFQITGTKLFAPAVTLSKENDAKLLQHLKTEFKRTAFTNVNRLFVLSFTRDNAGDNRDSFSDYYVPNVEIKDFNVLIDRKSFFDLPVKNEEEAFEKIIEMSSNNDYTTGNLLNFGYFKKHYKLIAIDLSKQTKVKDPQQINFIGRLWSNDIFHH